MGTLRETVYNSVINLHRNTKREWLHLSEIYDEVSKFKEVRNGGASIGDILETHSILSDAFTGTEEYILKEKGSGLYKSVYYDQLKFIDSINIGTIFTRNELMGIFKISGQSGIMKTNRLNCLVLLTTEGTGVYNDGIVENGLITYTGEGLVGDQEIVGNNKTIFESKNTQIPMYLFSKDKNKRYTFEGRVELCDSPYQVQEKDINNDLRYVWKFPLQIVYQNEYTSNNQTIEEILQEVIDIEKKMPCYNNLKKDDLKYVEGSINIRKYRRTGKKNQRVNRRDYIADEFTKVYQGIINEKVVYEYEVQRLISEEAYDQVEKMKEFFTNKKENEGFDVLSFEKNAEGKYVEKYIEVKSTKADEGTPIDITIDEIEFGKKHMENYYLYRIVYSDSDQRYLKIVNGVELFNDDNYRFVPNTFKIYSN